MKNIMQFVKRGFLLLVFVLCLLPVLNGCSSNDFVIDNASLRDQLLGKSVSLNALQQLSFTDDTLIAIDIVDTQKDNKTVKVFAKFHYEKIEPEKGGLNHQGRLNHLKYFADSDIVVTYSKFDKNWIISDISLPSSVLIDSSEIDNLLTPIPFNKSADEIISDLKRTHSAVSINEIEFNGLVMLSDEIPKNSFYSYDPMRELKEFDVVEISDGQNELFKNIKLSINLLAEQLPDVFNSNSGLYEIKGDFSVKYKLVDDDSGNVYWDLYNDSLGNAINLSVKDIEKQN